MTWTRGKSLKRERAQDSCDNPLTDCVDHASVQAFPANGPLAKHLNIETGELERLTAQFSHETIYAYVVRTVKWDSDLPGRVAETATAPNFQGGIMTLCTCKRSMRAGRDISRWPGTWIAGFSSKGGPHDRQGLFYLMRVERAFRSHVALWNAMDATAQRAKSMHRNQLGDLAEPRAGADFSEAESEFDPANYLLPCRGHSHEHNWDVDLDFRIDDRYERLAPLLAGDPRLSFLWSSPALYSPATMNQGASKHPSLSKFLSSLQAPHASKRD